MGSSVEEKVADALAWLERRGSQFNRDGMARYGIVAPKVFGVSMETMKSLAKKLGKDHELALALWDSGWYEARILTAFVDEPARVTPSQMDRWARDFDNWAICDTICFHLFDRTPYAWQKVELWSGRKGEFVKRAAFALIAGLALHDKSSTDAQFRKALRLIARESTDDRNFVKKGVSWALRSAGQTSASLHAAALELAEKLADSPDKSARWIGKDALKDLSRPLVLKRLAARERR